MTGPSAMSTLVTGASGFVGTALVAEFDRRGGTVTSVVRSAAPQLNRSIVVPDFLSHGLPPEAFGSVDCVVHAAARVHVMSETATDPLAAYRAINVDGTVRLARQAAAAGVRRFVFLSSVKVNGEGTRPGHPYRPDDLPAPVDPYGVSKLEAETALLELAAESGMEVVVIRPVLVYGPGVKGNFRAMLGWLRRGIPLPFGAVDNRRSLVAVSNLADLVATCVVHPAAANKVFLVSDGEDLSTTDLLHRAGMAMGKPARLIPVPSGAMRWAAESLGRGDMARRLLGSLQVDITRTRSLLGWTPPVTVDAALRETVTVM